MLKKGKLESCSNQLLIIGVGAVTALTNKHRKMERAAMLQVLWKSK